VSDVTFCPKHASLNHFCVVLLESTSSKQLLEGKVEAVNFAKQRESLKPSRLFVFWWWKGSRALRVEERRQHERLFQVLFDHSELQLWNWQCASPTRCVGTRHTRKIASQWEMICQLSCPWWELLQAFETSRCMHLHVQMFSEEREAEGFGNIKFLRWYSLILFFILKEPLLFFRCCQESPAQFSTLFFRWPSLPAQNHAKSLGDTGFVASSLNLTAWDVASNGSSEHYGQVLGMWGCTVLEVIEAHIFLKNHVYMTYFFQTCRSLFTTIWTWSMIHTHTLSHNWKSSEFLVDMYLAEIGLMIPEQLTRDTSGLISSRRGCTSQNPRREFFSVTSASRTASQALGGTVNVNFKRCVGYWPVWVLQDMSWLLPWLWMNRCNVTSILPPYYTMPLPSAYL